MSKKSRAETAAMLADAGDSVIKEPAAEPMSISSPANEAPKMDTAEIAYRELPLDRVFASPLNPRKHVKTDDLPLLARSIAEKGLLQPILVRPARQLDIEGERWEIIHGARRHAAAALAAENGWLPVDWQIPARIRACSDDELVILAGVENFGREDMEPLDEAELFAAVRPHVIPNAKPDGTTETREAAVARLFHVGERTVYRRLALLRCAPEVQEALRDDKITLGQANALSLGAPDKQRELLPAAIDPKQNWGEKLDPDDIRHEIVETNDDLVEWEKALFDPADYHGEVIEDADSGDKWFADRGQFLRLQELAIHAKAEEFAAEWPWVEIEHANWLDRNRYTDWNILTDDPEAGAVILVADGGERVEIKSPVLKIKARAKDAGADERPDRTATPKETARPPLSSKQIDRLHEAKTQALRRAIAGRATHDGRVPTALACLGLLGARELAMRDTGYASSADRIEPIANTDAEMQRLQHLLKTVALELSAAHKRRLVFSQPGWLLNDEPAGGNTAAAWFAALMALPADDLDELFARLVAERAGSWVLGPNMPNSGARVGDSPLAAAIAVYTAAETELPALWRPDLDWFLGYGRERLVAIVRDQLKIRNAEKMKKAELAQLCAEQPKGFWRPEHFPECRFQSEAEALKALAAPLPPAEG